MRFALGIFVVFDRRLPDDDWFAQLDQQSVFWVTRLKDSAALYWWRSNAIPTSQEPGLDCTDLHLSLHYLQLKSRFGWRPSNLMALVRH